MSALERPADVEGPGAAQDRAAAGLRRAGIAASLMMALAAVLLWTKFGTTVFVDMLNGVLNCF